MESVAAVPVVDLPVEVATIPAPGFAPRIPDFVAIYGAPEGVNRSKWSALNGSGWVSEDLRPCVCPLWVWSGCC
jgi:hypothetical protein